MGKWALRYQTFPPIKTGGGIFRGFSAEKKVDRKEKRGKIGISETEQKPNGSQTFTPFSSPLYKCSLFLSYP